MSISERRRNCCDNCSNKRVHTGCSNCQNTKYDRCGICNASGKCSPRKYASHARHMYKDNIRDDKKKIRYKCAVDTTYEDNVRQKSKDDCIWSKCYNNSNIKQIGISDSKVVYVLEKYTSRGLSGGGLLSERRRPKKKHSTRGPHSPHNSHGQHGLHGNKDYDDEINPYPPQNNHPES